MRRRCGRPCIKPPSRPGTKPGTLTNKCITKYSYPYLACRPKSRCRTAPTWHNRASTLTYELQKVLQFPLNKEAQYMKTSEPLRHLIPNVTLQGSTRLRCLRCVLSFPCRKVSAVPIPCLTHIGMMCRSAFPVLIDSFVCADSFRTAFCIYCSLRCKRQRARVRLGAATELETPSAPASARHPSFRRLTQVVPGVHQYNKLSRAMAAAHCRVLGSTTPSMAISK